MNTFFDEVIEDYLAAANKAKVGCELIVPMMLISELRRINDHLSWMSQGAREKQW